MTTTARARGIGDELAQAAGELLAGLLARREVRATIDREGFSLDAWAAVARAGWFEVMLAEEHGGFGLRLAELGGIASAVGRHLLPGPVADHTVVVPRLVQAVRAPARETLLSAISGARVIVFADEAAHAGSVSTRPRLSGGDLTGTVEMVRFGAQADDLLVVAGDEADRPAVALVSASGPGVTVTAQPSFDPITRYATVRLDAAPVQHLILEPGADTAAIIGWLRAAVRLLAAAEIAGVVRGLLDMSVAYALNREQFDRPIGSFQALQHLLADMAAAVLLLEAASADALHRASGPTDIKPMSWQLKALASRTGRQVAEGALQVHGGIAFTVEHEAHRGVEHVLALQGFYGDERELAQRLGRALLSGELQPWS